MKRIGILTGGGDCPGLNPVIRAAVKKGIKMGYETVGIKNGWKGLIKKDTILLDERSVSGILPRGGTILKTSRTNPYKEEDGQDKALHNIQHLNLDAVIAIGGGYGTLSEIGHALRNGIPVVGLNTWSLSRNDRPDNSIILAQDPAEAVNKAIGSIKNE